MAIVTGGLVLLVIIFYFFTIDEIEIGIPPKVKFKRRSRLNQQSSPDPSSGPLQTTPPAVPATKTETLSEHGPAEPPRLHANLVHPYPLQANFTGRLKERGDLTAWLADDEHPIYELIAMGGMGKSALTWVWLTQDVLKSSDVKLDGVMWWSFYEGESSFAKFVDEALKYVGDKPIDAEQFPTTYDRAQELRRLLQNKCVLFVLDGFERQLRAYAGFDAAYKSHDQIEPSADARSCVDPITSRLLRDIASVTTLAKILLTSRLPVSDLQDRAGEPLACVIERELEQLSLDDAITFMRAQGVTQGADAEIVQVCESYGYHALSLRLLSGLIEHDAKIPGDIKAAPRHEVHDDLIQRQHHVLEQSYDVLPKRERALLSRIAAFRGPMDYQAISVFNTLGSEKRFEDALENLRVRGLLQREVKANRYDLHPIVRHYAYQRLAGKTDVHDRLRKYFAKFLVTDVRNLSSLEELAPVIECYHHTVRATHYDEAFELYREELNDLLFYRFGASQLSIDLLRTLFPNGEDRPPKLQDERNQSWARSAMGNSYGILGQARRSLALFEQNREPLEKANDKENLAIVLGNMAGQQVGMGELLDAERNLLRRVELSREVHNEFREAITHQNLGLLFAYRGDFDTAEEELERGIKLHSNDEGGRWWQGTSWLYRAYAALMRHDERQALKAAKTAKELKDIEYPGVGTVERDVIQAAWLLGVAMVMEATNLTNAAEHLTVALTRCRRINLVEFEPNILLAWARWHRAKGNNSGALALATEAVFIADRCEYRLNQADIHNFLAQLALDAGDQETARKQAEIAKERAWCDGPPHCYKPALDEAERMLKELGSA